MDCRALDALNPTLLALADGKLLLLTPLCDVLPLGRSLPSSPASAELLYFLSANPPSPSAFGSYAKTRLCRPLLSVLRLSATLLMLYLLPRLTLLYLLLLFYD